MERDMPKTIEVSKSIAQLMRHLSRALHLYRPDRQSPPIPPSELVKRFELLLQCGF
jgi:hypothetical protein